jgi:hypothetical protein
MIVMRDAKQSLEIAFGFLRHFFELLSVGIDVEEGRLYIG